jgi:beta-glucosidase
MSEPASESISSARPRGAGRGDAAVFDFRDPELPLAARIDDLLRQLTLAEKVALLHQRQAAIPRLGVAEFRTGTEALHGLAWLGPATVFPQAVGLASTWNPALVRAVGAAVGDETRGFHHKDPSGAGLNVWAPVVNPLRDPRWGRNEEGYAEDSWLTGVMATAYAEGLRGNHPTYLKTAPTLKHFLGYNNETDRDTSSSNLPPRVLHEYELPAYRAPLAAGAAVALMPSYNLVNGRPAHLSPLINEAVRGWVSTDILVVSDAGAPANLVSPQHYHRDHAEGYAAALKAGLDSFTQDSADSAPTTAHLTEALRRGLLTVVDVDTAVRHILAIRFRLGEFDPIERNPYAAITEEVINCPDHQALAREAARQSIVLLNNRGLLPLAPGRTRRIAVVGPLADTLYEDWYSGTLPYAVTARAALTERLGEAAVGYAEGVDRIALRVGADGPYVVATDSPDGGRLRSEADIHPGPAAWFDVFDWGRRVHALRSVANGKHVSATDEGVLVNDQPRPNGWVVKEIFRLVERGTGVLLHHLATDRYVTVDADGTLRATGTLDEATAFTVELVASGVAAAVAAAQDADVAVVVLGNNPLVNGRETQDRADLALPPAQEALVRAVHAVNPQTVLVITSSYPFAVGWAAEHLPAVLWCAHSGQESGHALADVLFGDEDPGGRLTQTWYRSAAELPDLFDYDIIASDATYLYYRGAPLYPFGHGLSYTTFEYRNLRLSAGTAQPDGEVTVSVEVVNAGDRPGDEVVQLYTRQMRSRAKQPVRQLRGFRRISLAPGESTTVTLPLRVADLNFWDVTRGRPVIEAAQHRIMVGRSATDIALATTLTVAGERIPHRDPLSRPLWAVEYDDYCGIALREEYPSHGEVVSSAEAESWIAFENVDLGAPAALATCTARVSRSAPGSATVTVRLDDPLAGYVAAVFDVSSTKDRYVWTDVPAELTGASGVRDVYVVFESEGVALSRLTFQTERESS